MAICELGRKVLTDEFFRFEGDMDWPADIERILVERRVCDRGERASAATSRHGTEGDEGKVPGLGLGSAPTDNDR